LLQYSTDQIDSGFTVNNPEYNKITYKLGKLREKIARRKATLYELQEQNIEDDLEKANAYLDKQLKNMEELKLLKQEEQQLLQQRSKMKSTLKISEMPEEIRYTKLNTESKRFQNIVKMICYRAETSLANLLSDNYAKSSHEKRTLVKSIIDTHGDIIPEYNNKTLRVKLYSQTAQRMNKALKSVIGLLNETETKYPGTDLVIRYEIAT
jgi:DNA repair ATPase RecN